MSDFFGQYRFHREWRNDCRPFGGSLSSEQYRTAFWLQRHVLTESVDEVAGKIIAELWSRLDGVIEGETCSRHSPEIHVTHQGPELDNGASIIGCGSIQLCPEAHIGEATWTWWGKVWEDDVIQDGDRNSWLFSRDNPSPMISGSKRGQRLRDVYPFHKLVQGLH